MKLTHPRDFNSLKLVDDYCGELVQEYNWLTHLSITGLDRDTMIIHASIRFKKTFFQRLLLPRRLRLLTKRLKDRIPAGIMVSIKE